MQAVLPMRFNLTLVDTEKNRQDFSVYLTSTQAPMTPVSNQAELITETDHVDIVSFSPSQRNSTLRIDGNAWRDLESSDRLADFLRKVYVTNEDPEDYLLSLAEELGVDQALAGKIL